MPLPDLSPKPKRPRPALQKGAFQLHIDLSPSLFDKLALYKEETYLSYRRIVEKALENLFANYSFQELKTATAGVHGNIKEFKK